MAAILSPVLYLLTRPVLSVFCVSGPVLVPKLQKWEKKWILTQAPTVCHEINSPPSILTQAPTECHGTLRGLGKPKRRWCLSWTLKDESDFIKETSDRGSNLSSALKSYFLEFSPPWTIPFFFPIGLDKLRESIMEGPTSLLFWFLPQRYPTIP